MVEYVCEEEVHGQDSLIVHGFDTTIGRGMFANSVMIQVYSFHAIKSHICTEACALESKLQDRSDKDHNDSLELSK